LEAGEIATLSSSITSLLVPGAPGLSPFGGRRNGIMLSKALLKLVQGVMLLFINTYTRLVPFFYRAEPSIASPPLSAAIIAYCQWSYDLLFYSQFFES